jgi:hypothetical protein
MPSPIRLGSLKFEEFCAHRELWPGLSADSTPRLESSRLPEPYVEGLGARGSMANYGHYSGNYKKEESQVQLVRADVADPSPPSSANVPLDGCLAMISNNSILYYFYSLAR